MSYYGPDDALRDIDPSGLIREAYRIDSLHISEARSIFLDWALKLPLGSAPDVAITRLLAVLAGRAPADHPMTQILRDGLRPATRARRGGRAGRG
ncbi:hypothetical protein AQS8620_01752 [Aquimixticola soesokkakensis]|uniref:Uncharacterized protein n=1 Tax=Aquimixticola soesokkakensis TaxID=1519096 RepID=A0A1Y5SMA3_9RHOB|nr:hypothetical protein [Aquimixticola soesokkakensis]SLN44023.1 hypothetical protein AQS8620_01752 [Aquimixticola soesokkakensis]